MKKTLLLLATVSLVSACAYMPSKTGGGFLFKNVIESEVATANQGSRTGEACSSNILGLITTGDSSIEAAKAKGRISKVSSVDAKITSFLALFGKRCTIVTGQ